MLSKEDKADIKKKFGGIVANKIKNATDDGKKFNGMTTEEAQRRGRLGGRPKGAQVHHTGRQGNWMKVLPGDRY